MKSTYELINEFRKEMNDRFDDIKQCYVTSDRFKPVEMLAYGMAGFILITVLGAIIAGVIVKISPTSAQDITTQITPVIREIGNTLANN